MPLKLIARADTHTHVRTHVHHTPGLHNTPGGSPSSYQQRQLTRLACLLCLACRCSLGTKIEIGQSPRLPGRGPRRRRLVAHLPWKNSASRRQVSI